MPPKDSLLKIRLPSELKEATEIVASQLGESVSTVVRESIRRFLETYDEEHRGARSTGSKDESNPLLSHDQVDALRDLIEASQRLAEQKVPYLEKKQTRKDDSST